MNGSSHASCKSSASPVGAGICSHHTQEGIRRGSVDGLARRSSGLANYYNRLLGYIQ
jgi:hypothetical protein